MSDSRTDIISLYYPDNVETFLNGFSKMSPQDRIEWLDSFLNFLKGAMPPKSVRTFVRLRARELDNADTN